MRLFIAVNLDDAIRNKIGTFISSLKEQYRKVKWVADKNLHFTLKFLGHNHKEPLDRIIQVLDEINEKGFVLSIAGIGVFPNMNRPKVLWLGVKKGYESMKTLFTSIEKRMISLNYPDEGRDYSAHLTIGRFKDKPAQQLIQFIKDNRDIGLGEILVNSYSLMESNLSGKGAIYKELKRFTLS